MPDTRWEAIDIKPFVYSWKVLLTATKPIFGPPDLDMEPIIVKTKAKPGATKRKATSDSQIPVPAEAKKKKSATSSSAIPSTIPLAAPKMKRLMKKHTLVDEDQIPLSKSLKSKKPAAEQTQATEMTPADVPFTPAEIQAEVPASSPLQPSSLVDVIDEVLKDIQIEEVPDDSVRSDQAEEPLREEIDQTTEAASDPTEEANQLDKSADIQVVEELTNLSDEEFDSLDLPTTSDVERLLKKKIRDYLDNRFLELADHNCVRTDLIEILLWRDIRLQPFEYMGVMNENLGGVHRFLDFEIRCRKLLV